MRRWLAERRRRREQAILGAICRGHHHGLAIMREADVSPVSLYPDLLRLEQEGRVYSRWEKPHEMPPGASGPRRRLYFTLEFTDA